MGTCTAFVFAALVEFTFVNYTWRTKGRINAPRPSRFESSSSLNKCMEHRKKERVLINIEEVLFDSTVSNIWGPFN